MKRDMDLVRSILLELEKMNEFGLPTPINLPDFKPSEISYHVLIMYEAGLLDAKERSCDIRSPEWYPIRMTWLGHEFLDASREPKRWEKAKEIALGAGGVTLEIMKAILIDLIKKSVFGA